MFSEEFAARVLSFDESAAGWFGRIAAERRLKGRPMASFDAQIAAIARAHDASLATRDTSGFEDCGISLINPWRD
jgi:toxin FitB